MEFSVNLIPNSTGRFNKKKKILKLNPQYYYKLRRITKDYI
jgi:hypothetical protein